MSHTLLPRSPRATLLAATLAGAALMAGLHTQAFAAPATAAGITRAQVLQDLRAYRESGLANLERDDSQAFVGTPAWQAARERYLALRRAAGLDVPQANAAMPTRADVQADLRAYRASGLETLENETGDHSDLDPALEAARARYAASAQQVLVR